MRAGLPRDVARWLEFEQRVNDRTFRESTHGPIDLGGRGVHPTYRPESRCWWPLEVVFLPTELTREYGPVRELSGRWLGVERRGGAGPLFVHPQAPAGHRRLRGIHGSERLSGVCVTPTSSFRALLASRGRGRPAVLKLSMGAVIGRLRRVVRETEVAAGVMMSAVMGSIPQAVCDRVGFDWFPEPAGLVDTVSRCGWILREFPRGVVPIGGSLCPVFSLTAARDGQRPMLIEMIERSGCDPLTFVVENLLVPYVRVLAYLLFEEGIQAEGHPQNVLFEIDAAGDLTGRLVLRDLSDMSVSLPLRIARGKVLPVPRPDWLPVRPPFPLATVAADHQCPQCRSGIVRGRDTVERYGLGSFVGSMTDMLSRWLTDPPVSAIERRYLELWQDAAVRSLRLKPLFRRSPQGLATDETLAWFLEHTDWASLGAVNRAQVPVGAEAALVSRRVRSRRGSTFRRIESPWGDLFLAGGLPAFFAPAF